MGLDITAYSCIHEATSGAFDPFRVYVNPGFTDHADALKSGEYTYVDSRFDFRAGSYSGYGQWRDWLSQTFVGSPAREVFADFGRMVDRPFIELINFSDCEGVIGPDTSAKLFTDFRANLDKAEAVVDSMKTDEAPWFLSRYFDWMNAFRIARNDGVVVFH